MKKITLVAILLMAFSLGANAQNYTYGRVAVPTQEKDTLFVVTPLYTTFKTIWDDAVDKKKPVVVPVATLDPYIRRIGTLSTMVK